MCTTVKSPKPKDPEKKDPVYLRNPYLDGLGINGEAQGRNSLRIDPGTPAAHAPIPGATTAPNPFPGLPGFRAGLGIGGFNGGGFSFGGPGNLRIN